ncbi:hypothetical protein BWQ96_08210 [Gracilariopsis chorda]|uniref:Uncharacterized protein n=1 Tax=Gracilariopsis chorda TaxID=448386 RepID=A0A2V3IJ37_9FLOR|nr:hypothetical protein BWQ96_08210 [Gracilariopsis chorda]|eukprot:PXF42104.1 hypothetical protein BWQ96_08210 [Gracilariopsis chorda]
MNEMYNSVSKLGLQQRVDLVSSGTEFGVTLKKSGLQELVGV